MEAGINVTDRKKAGEKEAETEEGGSLNEKEPEAALLADRLSGASLAYFGDAVYELYVRNWVLTHGSVRPEKLHKHTSAFVNAGAQSALAGLIESSLTEEEHAVYRRGRNAKTLTAAKNQSIGDYRRATGLEALIGWLFLKGEKSRIASLIELNLPKLNAESQPKPL